MAFTSTVDLKTVMGNKRVHFGTWTTDTTTGNINTGLGVCEGIVLQVTGASVSADQAAVEETFPVAGSAVTIHITSDVDGNYIAWGH